MTDRSRAMQDLGLVQKRWETSDWAQISYWFRGGRDTLVLVHGLGYSARMWRGTVAHLPDDVGILAIDVRGHGDSTLGVDHPSVDRWAADVLDILDAEGVEEAAMCGLSMGGYTALAVAAAAPERFRGFGFVSTAAGADDAKGRQGRAEGIQLLKTGGAAAFFDFVAPKYYWEGHPDHLHLRAEGVEEFERAGAVGLSHTLLALGNRPDRLSLLPEIRRPCVVVVGDQDVLTPPSKAEQIAAGLPDVDLHVIRNAAHMSAVEQPAAVAEAIGQL